MKKILLIFLFLLFSCQNEYINFHQNKQIQDEQNSIISKQLENFSFEKITYLSWLTLKETPSLELLDELITKIDNAEKRVYIEVYIFTEKRLKKALIKAKKRWIEVKVVLEKNVYLAPSMNKETFTTLEKNNIEVKYSNSENYALNHTKMMIIDDEVIISTGNYSYSTFKYNREFFLFLENEDVLKIFLDIFENDFNWNKKNLYHNNLVLSPFYSREKLEYLLKKAKESIKIYSHNFSDLWILKILLEKQKQWINIKMIFPDLKKVSSNEDEIKLFQENKIEINIINKPEIHAKAILIDEQYLYIWSINFSEYSIDKNREIGLLISNKDIIKKYLEIFDFDFKTK